jgi:stage V sporulation protein B
MTPESPHGQGAPRRSAGTFLTRVVVAPITFATTIITTRALGPELRGTFTLAMLAVLLSGTLLGGPGAAAAVRIGTDPTSRRWAFRASRRLAVVFGLVGAASQTLILLISRLTHTTEMLPLIAGATCLVLTQTLVTLRVLNRDNATVNRGQLSAAVVTLASTGLLLIVGSPPLLAASTGWSFGQLIGLLVLAPRRGSDATAASDSGAEEQQSPVPGPLLGLSLRLGAVNSLSLLNYRVEVLIVAAMLDTRHVGIYSVAVATAEVVWMTSSAIASALTAGVVEADHQRATDLIARGVKMTYTVALVAGAVVAACAPAAGLVFGSAFRAATVPLLVLVPGVVAFAPAALVAQYFTIRLGSPKIPLVASLLSTVVNAVACLAFIPLLGMTGAALASTIGYLSAMTVLLVIFVRRENLPVSAVIPDTASPAALISLLRQVMPGGRAP